MKGDADWLAWALQLIAGLAVGAFIGLRIITEDGHYSHTPGFWLRTEQVPAFLLGTALTGGAMASLLGDRLWIGQNYRLIPPEAPQQSASSRIVSIMIGAVGCILILFCLYTQFHPHFALPL